MSDPDVTATSRSFQPNLDSPAWGEFPYHELVSQLVKQAPAHFRADMPALEDTSEQVLVVEVEPVYPFEEIDTMGILPPGIMEILIMISAVINAITAGRDTRRWTVDRQEKKRAEAERQDQLQAERLERHRAEERERIRQEVLAEVEKNGQSV